MIVHADTLRRQFTHPAPPRPSRRQSPPLIHGVLFADEWRATPLPGRFSQESLICVACPACGMRNSHHWSLAVAADAYRSEPRHCPRCRAAYLVTPWRPSDAEYMAHGVDPESDPLSFHDESVEWEWFEGPATYYLLAN